MQLQITVTVDGRDPKAVQALLAKLAGTKAEATTPAKGKKAAPADEVDESDDVASDDAPEDEEFEMDDAAEESEEDAEPKVTKKDLLKALQAHPSKEKCQKLLKTKYKVKSINDLDEDQYAKVVADLKKLK